MSDVQLRLTVGLSSNNSVRLSSVASSSVPFSFVFDPVHLSSFQMNSVLHSYATLRHAEVT